MFLLTCPKHDMTWLIFGHASAAWTRGSWDVPRILVYVGWHDTTRIVIYIRWPWCGTKMTRKHIYNITIKFNSWMDYKLLNVFIKIKHIYIYIYNYFTWANEENKQIYSKDRAWTCFLLKVCGSPTCRARIHERFLKRHNFKALEGHVVF